MMMDQSVSKGVELSEVLIDQEKFYRISNVDEMRPFFMSIVSDSNHWMFIGSNGGLTAGRKDAEYSLFPYYTDDKLLESAENTGSKTIFQVEKEGRTHIWEPFSNRYASLYQTSRNLYKNSYGNKILFEEINHDLELVFRYQWSSSNLYGFVRQCSVQNLGNGLQTLTVLDGLQNIVPAGVESATQVLRSNLVDAYKRSELDQSSGVGIFGLSAIIVDRAEPSEALKANVVWSAGLSNPLHLLSSLQLDKFRNLQPLEEEVDVKGERGSYFVCQKLELSAKEKTRWMMVANVNMSSSAIATLVEDVKHDAELVDKVLKDVERGTKALVELNAAADAIQLSSDPLKDTRHYANVMFNIMRGGIFDDNYQIEKGDFETYLFNANQKVAAASQLLLDQLPEKFSLSELKAVSENSGDLNFRRLSVEYLPLKFSRRHGDPSRPWNRFSINTHSELDGSKILDYEGNWRDIFQNWEALANAYPEFIEGMIFRFLNASTFDGYNPYRITKNGIDWERIEPDDPWSYIGYWGDHQIIYLLKFFEFTAKHFPGKLEGYFDQDLFVYANVPYRIKGYSELLANPKDTIEFDEESDLTIMDRCASLGADGALLRNQSDALVQVNFVEKVLATWLAKMSNFIAGGGIWMNTQRPEWNDANNALVGNGVSMVTLYYLRRFLTFFNQQFKSASTGSVKISTELNDFMNSMVRTLELHRESISAGVDDTLRKTILDGLGESASEYRQKIYSDSYSGQRVDVFVEDLVRLNELCLDYTDKTIRASKRSDNLYQAYNIMSVERDKVSITHLSEMLEGQVAVLSSGYLSSAEALGVLDALKASSLYRADQASYILYPNKDLPGFTAKNNIPAAAVEGSELLKTLMDDGNVSIIERDINGVYHFNGNFRNANDLAEAMDALSQGRYSELISKDEGRVFQVFEDVFNHKAFTGRSGTFFGYEGLGSIYWHMVSKLALATMECCLRAIEEDEDETVTTRLLDHYYEIVEGIGVHKPPEVYGAFPTDPYSHTPAGKGVQQPGMTGQVKEDILCRFGELGVIVRDGRLEFKPGMLREEEFSQTSVMFSYVDVNSVWKEIKVGPGSLCFTYCQVPVIYLLSEENQLEVMLNDGSTQVSDLLVLNPDLSREVFGRTGMVSQILVRLKSA